MTSTPLKYLRKKDVLKQSAIGSTSLYYEVQEGTFPPPVPLGARAVGYLEHEVQAILAAKAAGYTPDQLKALVQQLIAKRETFMQQFIANCM
ncbi:MAG: transcriptional regulator [Kangiellaceae bacterium]|nr:transcriptional regulator [Kangiellaceae bacterium]|tara:strand:- start:53 stop:328 length:276 start_codon:yes stop_codon:yes gene_type:complete